MRWFALLLLAGAVAAQERPSTAQQADRVLAAAKDAKKLAELAAMSQPDRWSVADELSSRGEHEVAVAFARASDLKDKKQLLAYLASRRASPTPKGTWAVLWPLWNRAFAGEKGVAAAAEPYVAQGGFVGSFATTIHAVSLVQTGRAAEAVPLLERALTTMEELGCRNDTAWNLFWLGQAVPDKAEHYYRRVLALEEDVFGAGASFALGHLLLGQSRHAEAAPLLRAALDHFGKRGPAVRAELQVLLARALVFGGKPEEAERLARAALGVATRANVKADAHYVAGFAQQSLGRLDEAERSFRDALPFSKVDRAFELGVRGALAQVVADQGRHAHALRLADEVLARAPRSDTLALRARLLVFLGRNAEALPVAEQAVATAKAPAERAIALGAQGFVRVMNGDRPGALAALAAAAKAAADDPRVAASVATDFEGVARRTGDVALAIEHLERAIAYYETVGAAHELAGWYGNLATLLRKRGDLKRAADSAERGLKHAEALGDPKTLVRALTNVAAVTPYPARKREVADRALALADSVDVGIRPEIWSLCGHCLPPAESVPWLRKAIDAFAARGEKAQTAKLLHKLAERHHELFQPDEEQGALERSIRIAREVGDRGLLLWGESRLASVLSDRGQTEQARALLGRVLGAVARIDDPLSRRSASVALASTLIHLGEDERALALLDEVRALDEKGAGAPLDVAAAWNARGTALEHLERIDEALAAYRKALDVAKEYGISHASAATLGNMGWIHFRRGAHGQALECLEQSLALARAAGSDYGVFMVLFNISGVHVLTGDLAAARVALEATLEPARRHSRRRYARALSNLARVDLHEGKIAAARERLLAAREAEKGPSILRLLADTEPPGSDAQRAWLEKAAALGSAGALVDLSQWHASHKQWAEATAYLRRAQEAPPPLLLSRARMHAAAGIVEAGLGNFDVALSEAGESIRLLTHASAGLDDERAGGLRAGQAHIFEAALDVARTTKRPSAVFAVMESARAAALLQALGNREALRAVAVPAELRAAEREARRREAAAIERYQRALEVGAKGMRARWGEVRQEREGVLAVTARIQRAQRLRADVVYPKAAPLADVQTALQADEALVLFFEATEFVHALVLQEGRVHYHRFGNDVLAVAAAFRQAAGRAHARGLDVPPHETVPYLRARLRKALVEPLKLGDGVRRVLISPSGELAYVPFAALVDREVVYVPSATTYALLRARASKRGDKVLALGDPTSGDRLPATAAEARAVGDVVLLRDDASVARLGKALPARNWRAVHFACHGRIHAERPLLSSLQLSGGDLRCMDVFRMKIPADLVVLSACETGKGKVYKAEGVVGFTRAFMMAGTPRVIVSLWKVDDEATKALMVKFYELWSPSAKATEDKKPQPTATALKNAQKFVASHDKWKHPYYWAAWQLWGLPE